LGSTSKGASKQVAGGALEDSHQTANAVGLTYVTATKGGITRHKRGKGFIYRDANGKVVRDCETLNRIAALVIPPAWHSVWICPSPRGHIQALGRDERGRKQYRYHPKFRAVRDENKFARMLQFAKALPRIRRRVSRDLAARGLQRPKVLATIVRLLETTLIRIGNDQYAKTNKHYGLTTIKNRHAGVDGSTVRFHFVGKSGVHRDVELDDPKIARIIRRCQDLPGEALFEYIDDAGAIHGVGSGDVNEYLREISGADFTAKDFRTWAGTILAARTLAKCEKFDSQSQARKNIIEAIGCAARDLGNTRAVCKKCYIHPAILDRYLDGQLTVKLAKGIKPHGRPRRNFTSEEAAVLELLQGEKSPGKATRH
jgi:DNA topoisomerase-1